MESYSDEVLTMTLVFFFIKLGSRCFVVRYGPTTFVVKTWTYSLPALHHAERIYWPVEVLSVQHSTHDDAEDRSAAT